MNVEDPEMCRTTEQYKPQHTTVSILFALASKLQELPLDFFNLFELSLQILIFQGQAHI